MARAKTNYSALFEFHLKALGVPMPEAEVMFAKPRKWRFDFAWPNLKLAAEIEGGTWGKAKSRHTTGSGFEADCVKYNEAAILGWRVLTFTTKQVENGDAVRTVIRAINSLR